MFQRIINLLPLHYLKYSTTGNFQKNYKSVPLYFSGTFKIEILNRNGYGPVISSLPAQLSRFNFKFLWHENVSYHLVADCTSRTAVPKPTHHSSIFYSDRSSYRLWPNSFHLSSRIIQLAGDHVNFQKNSRTCHINPFQNQTVWER